MSTTNEICIAIIINYPEDCLRMYLIPETQVTDVLHERLVEESGGFPHWCFGRAEDDEDAGEKVFDLDDAISWPESPNDNELLNGNHYRIVRWYSYGV